MGLGIFLDAAPVVNQAMTKTWLVDDYMGYTTQYAGYNDNPSGETLSTNQSKGTTQSFEPRSTGMQCVNCQSSQEMRLEGAIDRRGVPLFVMLSKYN